MPLRRDKGRRRRRRRGGPKKKNKSKQVSLLKAKQEDLVNFTGEGPFGKLPVYIRLLIWEELLRVGGEVSIHPSRRDRKNPRENLTEIFYNEMLVTLLKTSPLINSDQRLLQPFWKVNTFRCDNLVQLESYTYAVWPCYPKWKAFRKLVVTCEWQYFSQERRWCHRCIPDEDFVSFQTRRVLWMLSVFQGLTSLELYFPDNMFSAEDPIQDERTARWVSGFLCQVVKALPALQEIRATVKVRQMDFEKFGIHITRRGCTYSGWKDCAAEAMRCAKTFKQIVRQYRGVWRLLARDSHEQLGTLMPDYRKKKDECF